MITKEMNLNEIRQAGVDVLIRELGIVGMVRFLQQFETGQGDYTKERHQWLPDNIQTIAEEINKMQQDEK